MHSQCEYALQIIVVKHISLKIQTFDNLGAQQIKYLCAKYVIIYVYKYVIRYVIRRAKLQHAAHTTALIMQCEMMDSLLTPRRGCSEML